MFIAVGSACSDKMQNIENILKTRIQNDQADTFVVIVPTDSARVKRQRELVGYHPNHAVANLRVLDIQNFVQRLYNQVRPLRQHVSQGIQNLWLHEIANPESENTDTYRYDAFRPNQNIAVPDSTLSLIVDTINHLRERGEGTLNIENGASSNPTRDDLARIYNDYETKLKDRWIDEQGKHLYLANNFESRFMKNAFPSVNLVVVEGFTVLSKADIKILTCIARMPNIELWFRTDCVEENDNLYKNITNLVSQFRAVDACLDTAYEREPNRHQRFAENLFHTDATRATSVLNSDTTSQIKMLEPADRSEEVEQIAHLIQKHVSKGHCKLSDICVAYYNVGHYRQRIAETFSAYGIPYSLVENLPLTKSEVVKAIFARLSSHRAPLKDAYFSDVESASHTRMFHPDAFQRYVNGLLADGKVIHNILNPMLERNNGIVEGEVEAYRQFKKIVKELCNMLKSEGEGSYFLSDYIEKLHRIARHTNYRNRATTTGEAVKIAQLGELRSLEFGTVFLGDFVESRLPENYRPDPLLPEIPYRTEEEQLHDNRFMFYRVLKSFRERLYILIPQREREAELIPSPFLGQLKAIADIETEEIPNPSQGSVPGFLSTYGNHVWTAPTTSNGGFPAEIENMRPLIDHVIAVEKSREATHEHLVYEGVLTAAPLSAESRERLERRQRWTYSVTELETYAKCPFQYFADKVLDLGSKDEEDLEGLSSREKGDLVHEVLVRFYDNRRKQSAISQCDDAGFEAAKQQLADVIDKVITSDTASEDLFRTVDKALLKVTLNQWLAVEREYDVVTTPRYFEVSVGRREGVTDSVLSRAESISIDGVRLNAKIDRIDIGDGVFNVIDYKSGSLTPGINDILEGRALQLPIYLEIAKQLLGTGYEAAAGLYHKVRLNDCRITLGIGKESYRSEAYILKRKTQQMLSNESFDGTIVRVSGYLAQYVNRISDGNFPLITRVETFVDSKEEGDTPITPRNKTAPCSYCDYKRVCRVGAISEVSQSDD